MNVFQKLFTGAAENSQIKVNMENYQTSSGVVSENTSTGTTNMSSNVDEDAALKIAALYQGINIIADTIAAMPVYVYTEVEGFQQVNTMDTRSRALSDMANEVLTAYNLKKNLVKDLILYGNAYAKINRKGKEVTLDYLPTSVVTPRKDSTGYFFSVQSYSTGVTGEMVPAQVVDFGDMLTLIRNPKYNSIQGEGLLTYASEIFDMSIQETHYMINLFKNGLSAKAVLSSKSPFKKEVKEKLKSDLREFYSGASNSGKMLVLEGDIAVQNLSLTPTDIKLIENKHFTISEIARFLNIPKHMLSLDRQQGTYSNITQERMQLLTNTLTPYVVAIEGALNQKLLTDKERSQGYYFQFNTSEMLKLTPEDNARYMLELYKENVVTLEEVRATLNLGGDEETIAQLKKYDDLKVKQVETLTAQASAKTSKKEVDKEEPIPEEVDEKDVDTSKKDTKKENF